MVTKDQALTADEFHYNHAHNSDGTCQRWRRNGATKTWKSARRSEEFRIPVKYGMYGYGAITDLNASDYHLASECPYGK